MKKLTKAKVEPWVRLFHSMRASRQTELEHEYPTHVVCAWLGNSVTVAQKSYLLVTEADVAKAINDTTRIRGTNPTRAGSKSGVCETKTTLHGTRTEEARSHIDHEKDSENLVFAGNSLIKSAEDKGFEPSTGFPAPDFESGS